MAATETLFEEIKRYVRFDATDEAALRAFHPHAKPYFHGITDEFYDRLSEHPEARRVLADDAQIQRLKGSLVLWLDKLLTGPWDEEYYQQRARIGRVHVKVKLPQRYMLTAMDLIRRHLIQLASGAFAGQGRQREQTQLAVDKIIDLELAIMLETYQEDYIATVRHLEQREKDLLQRRLEISEARYMAIVENAAALVIASDDEHRVVLFNRTAEAVTGYPRSEMIGQNCFETLCAEPDAAAIQAAFDAAVAGAPQPPLDASLRTRDGQLRTIRWHITTLAASEGPIACLIGIDVTEEVELAQRTRRAERLASLGTLAAGLAHEIRNPLNAAKLQLMLVERRLQKPAERDQRRALQAAHVVQEELQRLAGLVQDFLSFARKTELRIEHADLRATVRLVAELLAPTAAEAGVELSPPHDGEPLTACFDPERIKQVLLNLVRNAIEAAGRGGRVSIELELQGSTAHVCVLDTGPGIPPGIDAFEPFATTKDTGTGLGLPIVHRIASDHGGDIGYRRRQDQTVFELQLPLQGPPRRG